MRLVFFLPLLSLACDGGEVDPPGVFDTDPLSVYNQAHQQNFAVDNIPTILAEARNGYVLLDPFTEDEEVRNAVPVIKANNNEVGAYISIGTGETYRSDFQ